MAAWKRRSTMPRHASGVFGQGSRPVCTTVSGFSEIQANDYDAFGDVEVTHSLALISSQALLAGLNDRFQQATKLTRSKSGPSSSTCTSLTLHTPSVNNSITLPLRYQPVGTTSDCSVATEGIAGSKNARSYRLLISPCSTKRAAVAIGMPGNARIPAIKPPAFSCISHVAWARMKRSPSCGHSARSCPCEIFLPDVLRTMRKPLAD